MYGFFLILHSVVRWLVVISAVLTVGKALLGWMMRQEWRLIDDRLGMLFTMALDIQFLVGIILYFFLSPLTTTALLDFGPVMSNPVLRYFSVEHVFMMVIAIGIAHAGRSMSKKAAVSSQKFKRAALLFSAALIIILFSIPWPFLSVGRPWIRLS